MAIEDVFGRQITDAVLSGTKIAESLLVEVKNLRKFQEDTDQKTRQHQYEEVVKLLGSIDGKLGNDTAAMSAQVKTNLAASPAATNATGRPRGNRDKIPPNFHRKLLLYTRRMDKYVLNISNILLGKKHGNVGGTTVAAMAAGGTVPAMIRGKYRDYTTGRAKDRALAKAAGASGDDGGGGDDVMPAARAPIDWDRGWAKWVKRGGQAIAATGDALLDAMDIDPEIMWKGALKDSFRFVKNMRMTAAAARGWGEDTQAVAKQWLEVGEQQKQTGYYDGQYKKILTKEAQKGLTKELKYDGKKASFQRRSVKDQIAMVKTSMHTAFIIGASVEETADLFSDWQRNLGLSNEEIDHMSMSMKNIARTTGMSGQNLIDVLKSSESIFKELRKQGALNAASMANVTELMALYKKHGAEAFGAELMTALSSFQNYIKASPEMQGLISRSAMKAPGGSLMDRVYAGNMQKSRKDMGAFFKGMDIDMTQQLKNLLPGMTSLEDIAKTLEDLDLGIADKRFGATAGEQRMKAYSVRQQMQQLGMSPQDLEAQLKVREDFKSPLERITELEAKRAVKGADKAGLTKDIDEQQKVLDKEKYAHYRDSLKHAANTPEGMRHAMLKANRQMDEQKLLRPGEAFGKDDLKRVSAGLIGDIRGKTQTLGRKKEMDELLAKQGSEFNTLEKIQAGMSSDNVEVSRAAGAAYNAMQQAIDQFDHIKDDPQMLVNYALIELNSTAQQQTQKIAENITATQLLTAAIAAMTAHIAGSLIPKIVEGVMALFAAKWVGGKFASMLGFGDKGAKAAAAAAEATKVAEAAKVAEAVKVAGGGAKAAEAVKVVAGGDKVLAAGAEVNKLLKPSIFARALKPVAPLAKFAGAIAGPLALGAGAYSGYTEAEQHGMSRREGLTFGALTGGAETGSMISQGLGAEKGGAIDQATGVGTAALHGAAVGGGIGLALAPFTAALSVPVATAIGAAVGAIAEVIKINWIPIKEGFSSFMSWLGGGLSGFAQSAKEWLGMGTPKGTAELDKKVAASVKQQQEAGVAQAHNDPTNPMKNQWATKEANAARVAGGIKDLTDNPTMSPADFNKKAQDLLLNASQQKVRMGVSGDQWTPAINAVKQGAASGIPLEKSTQDALDAMEQKDQMEKKWFEIRRTLIDKKGMHIGSEGVTKESFDKATIEEFEKIYNTDEAKKFYEEATKGKSIYVHDITMEEILGNILSVMSGTSKVGASYVGMGAFDTKQAGEAMNANAIASEITEPAASSLDVTNKMLATIIDIMKGKTPAQVTRTVDGIDKTSISDVMKETNKFTKDKAIASTLESAYEAHNKSDLETATASNLGMFEKSQSTEAMSLADRLTSRVTESNQSKEDEYTKLHNVLTGGGKSGGASPIGLGAFDGSTGSYAMDEAFRVNENRFSMSNTIDDMNRKGNDSFSNTIDNMTGNKNSLESILRFAEHRKDEQKGYTTMQGMGMFDANLGRDAMSDSDNISYQKMLMENAGFGPGHPAITGIGSPIGATANSVKLQETLKRLKAEEENRKSVSMRNEGMFDNSLKESNIDNVNSLSELYGLNLNSLPGKNVGRTKGDVSTNSLTMEDADHYVGRVVEGEKPSGPAALIPGLDSILDYMRGIGEEKQDEIIKLLAQIAGKPTTSMPPPIMTSSNFAGAVPSNATMGGAASKSSGSRLLGTSRPIPGDGDWRAQQSPPYASKPGKG